MSSPAAVNGSLEVSDRERLLVRLTHGLEEVGCVLLGDEEHHYRTPR